MPVRGVADQALAARAASMQPHHVRGGRGLVDEHQRRRVEEVLLPDPAPTRPSHIRPRLLAGVQNLWNGPPLEPAGGKLGRGSEAGSQIMQIAIIGIDLGKNSCSVVALDGRGAVVKRRRMRRESIVALTKGIAPCVVAMEACCGAHHLGRLLAAQGHQVRLMSPEYVRPYVKAQKNDDRDAEAIAEAATRPTMRFVELKSEEQLDMQTLHRARDRLVAERTALINQLRAILLERGIAFPQGRRRLEQSLAEMMAQEGENGLSHRMQLLIEA